MPDKQARMAAIHVLIGARRMSAAEDDDRPRMRLPGRGRVDRLAVVGAVRRDAGDLTGRLNPMQPRPE